MPREEYVAETMTVLEPSTSRPIEKSKTRARRMPERVSSTSRRVRASV
jgi:hypothetical protein